MALSNPDKSTQLHYECIHCSSPTPSLYLKYSDPSNTSLLQCSACSRIADVYQSFDFPVLLLDLLLLKREVYRHFLRNRGGTSTSDRCSHRARETVRLGAIVVGVDALVRCIGAEARNESEALLLYLRTLGYCLIETLSLLLCTALAACLAAPSTAKRDNLALVPLTSFYASLPTISFLVISSIIWRDEYLPSPTDNTASSFLVDQLDSLYEKGKRLPTRTGIDDPLSFIAYLTSFSRANLRSGLAQVGEARGWASEALLRKGIGGTSAIVAFSVLLRCSKRRAAAVLLLAWLLHLVLLHAVDPFLL